MTIYEKIYSYLEECTGISITEDLKEDIMIKVNDILNIIGYAQEAEDNAQEKMAVNIAQNGIDGNLIKYLEELSRLRLTEDEEITARKELTKILSYMDMLNEIDTEGVEDMSHPFPYTNNFREDECLESTDRELILKNAPQQKDGSFKVPTTVE